jgi:hypothetical protein
VGILRAIFWFETGQIDDIATKLGTAKPKYEANWEAEVLFALIGFVVFGFLVGVWFGIAAVFFAKNALIALDKKRFFDPLP